MGSTAQGKEDLGFEGGGEFVELDRLAHGRQRLLRQLPARSCHVPARLRDHVPSHVPSMRWCGVWGWGLESRVVKGLRSRV
eukprot:3419938-Rhodomonas_salina.1